MIHESDVVDAVCCHLVAQEWDIGQRLGPTEKGDDIIATRGNEEFRIEAKGEGSEQPTSSRHGKPFTRNQVRSHVAVAFYRAARMRTDTVRAGMAFPDNEHHREMVAAIERAIRDLGINVYWVSADGSVTGGD